MIISALTLGTISAAMIIDWKHVVIDQQNKEANVPALCMAVQPPTVTMLCSADIGSIEYNHENSFKLAASCPVFEQQPHGLGLICSCSHV